METEPSAAQPAQPAATNQQFSFQLLEQPGLASNNNVNTETIQNINNLSLTGQINSPTELQFTNVELILQEPGAWPTSLPVNVPRRNLLVRLTGKAPRNLNYRLLCSSTPSNWHNFNSCSN